MCLEIFEAPCSYRSHLIHMSIDGELLHVNIGGRQLRATTWPELKEKIDAAYR